MTPVMQTIIATGDAERPGDCMRAAYASLLDLDLTQVPHFLMYKSHWWVMLEGWLKLVGFYYSDYRPYTPGRSFRGRYRGVKGIYSASVPSRTYPGGKVTHAVLIDASGVVVHDPNPNQLWAGVNVIESGELLGIDIIKRI